MKSKRKRLPRKLKKKVLKWLFNDNSSFNFHYMILAERMGWIEDVEVSIVDEETERW